MSGNATPITDFFAERCSWFPRPKTEEGKEKCASALKITLFVVSLLALIVTAFAALASLGMMPQGFALNSLGTIGQFASGILLTVTLLTTVYLGALIARLLKEKCCNKKETAPAPIVEQSSSKDDKNKVEKKDDAPSTTTTIATNQAKEPDKKSTSEPVKKWYWPFS